jgi:hypothetical protein
MLTSHELFGFMPPALAQRILEEVHGQDREAYRSALHAVALSRKVRPVFLEHQPRVERHKEMAVTLARPSMEAAAAPLLRVWLLKTQKTLLVDFLDALGVPHQEGVVENLPESVEEAKLRTAIDAILAKHPREIVTVYLQAFNTMNETRWTALDQALRSDERLQLA